MAYECEKSLQLLFAPRILHVNVVSVDPFITVKVHPLLALVLASLFTFTRNPRKVPALGDGIASKPPAVGFPW